MSSTPPFSQSLEPTQGTFETDEDRIIRIKYYSQYGYGQYPNAVTFDKMDIVRAVYCWYGIAGQWIRLESNGRRARTRTRLASIQSITRHKTHSHDNTHDTSHHRTTHTHTTGGLLCFPFDQSHNTPHGHTHIQQVGKRADPFYKYLCLTLRNPNKIARITLNFEKVRFAVRRGMCIFPFGRLLTCTRHSFHSSC